MLLVVARLPQDPSAPGIQARIAALCGLAAVDVQVRLGGPLPRVLLSDANAGRIEGLAAELAALGVAAFPVDPARVPGDARRIVVRRLEAQPTGLCAIAIDGSRHDCARAGMRLLQRGVRVTTTTETTKITERKFSLGRAALSGGLLTKKSVEREVHKDTESRDAFVLVGRDDGPDLILYERRLDYRFLGAEMGPASAGNLLAALRFIRAAAPDAALDERVLRPGFVRALPTVGPDPVDLALHLVRLSLPHETYENR